MADPLEEYRERCRAAAKKRRLDDFRRQLDVEKEVYQYLLGLGKTGAARLASENIAKLEISLRKIERDCN